MAKKVTVRSKQGSPDGPSGMYAPWVTTAYERLQGELSSYLSAQKTGSRSQVRVEEVHSREDVWREQDVYVYRLTDGQGNALGEVCYNWEGNPIIEANVTDATLQRAIQRKFGTGRELFDKYVREAEKKLRE